MNIGIFTDTYFPQVSGVSTSIRVLKEELERRGHKVIIFTTTDPKATALEHNIVRLGSIPLFSFKERRIAVNGWGKAYKAAKEHNLDIIHTQTEFGLGLLGRVVANMLKIPTVHTYHTMYEKYLHYIANGKVLKPAHVAYISKSFCNQTSGVIAPSQMTKDTLLRYGVLQEIRVIPTGVEIPEQDISGAQQLRYELGYTKDEFVLLSLSRVSQEKNIAAVIAAMPEIIATNDNVRLCIVGDGPERKVLEQQTRDLNLEDYIQFTGEIDPKQVYRYYQMADLYVNASESESQGLTYLEALVNRVPVIAKYNDYLNGLLTDTCLGVLCHSDEELASTILEYMNYTIDTELAEQLRASLISEISVATFADRVLDLYNSAIAGYNWHLQHEQNKLTPKYILKSIEKIKDEIHD
ncbi:1,2-diacylglycerol 3-alpha-glucosyltransferase [Granulicatella balaenopterae]|uniref:1,2-diacylglycerol 3-alpha-glucosyltransferase n=1 Tax=Granulicatella balaenopterae TaxID=137733 RepID=A0A1H9IEA1_9LACT|nr:glycosyltransferase family 4 protein [Granulicatella balaenopterae]SEQ72906.1 1,2-diacylglycerol 3-alpha-glucosyltransferase [Granulicatella balaenopterae]